MTPNSGTVRAENSRLILRDLLPEDVEERYVSWLNDPEVNRYLESRFADHCLEDVRAYVRVHKEDPDESLLAICTKPTGKHIGNIKIGSINRTHGTAEIGLLIGDTSEWGIGYGTEAIALATRYAFTELGFRRLTAGAYRGNEASIRAFERCGYQIEGVLREPRLLGNRSTDAVVAGMLSREAPPQ